MTDKNMPAFPQYVPTGIVGIDKDGNAKREFQQIGGMTLRDWFAGMALNGLIVGNNADECVMGLGNAKDAYNIADAMMKARGE